MTSYVKKNTELLKEKDRKIDDLESKEMIQQQTVIVLLINSIYFFVSLKFFVYHILYLFI